MFWLSEILKDLRHLIFFKETIRKPPMQRVELIVEVSFDTFVQVSFTDGAGKYRIKDFTGKYWKTDILLYEEREVLFSVFVNNHLLKKDQYILMTRKVNDEITGKQKIDLSNSLTYEGWFRLN
jgi:hypothetical protein